jgi:hypothetical protein
LTSLFIRHIFRYKNVVSFVKSNGMMHSNLKYVLCVIIEIYSRRFVLLNMYRQFPFHKHLICEFLLQQSVLICTYFSLNEFYFHCNKWLTFISSAAFTCKVIGILFYIYCEYSPCRQISLKSLPSQIEEYSSRKELTV